MQPHPGQLPVAFSDHIFHRVEGVVKLDQQPLRPRIIKPIHGDQVHVVEGEILELGVNEVILLGVTWHDVS